MTHDREWFIKETRQVIATGFALGILSLLFAGSSLVTSVADYTHGSTADAWVDLAFVVWWVGCFAVATRDLPLWILFYRELHREGEADA